MKPVTLLLTALAAVAYAGPVVLSERAVSAAQVDDAATKLDALSAKVETLSTSISTLVSTPGPRLD